MAITKGQRKFLDDYQQNRNYDDTIESYTQRQGDMDKAREKRAEEAKKKTKKKGK